MSNIFDEIVNANKKYAADFGTKKNLVMPPARKTAILTCMETFNNEIMNKLLGESLATDAIDKDGWKNVVHGKGSNEGKFINWLTIPDQKQSIIEDLNRIRNHPLVNRDIAIKGYLYDVRSGKLTEIYSV